MRTARPLGNPTDKAWIAGWDAALTFAGNPYSRQPQREAFDRGRKAGLRSSIDDVRALKLKLARKA